MQHVEKQVMPASTVFTDEAAMYQNVGESGYFHKRIKHAEHVYLSGQIHTNPIEGFWSLTKRGISGVYHAVSAKYLQGHLNEDVWRYNERDFDRTKFSSLLRRSALTGVFRRGGFLQISEEVAALRNWNLRQVRRCLGLWL